MKSSNTYITHLMADTANGVQIVDPIDFPEVEWIGFNDFINELSGLVDDEMIFTAVDPDQMDELKKEYTVN